MQSFMVNGVRKAKPRFSLAYFQPLSIVDLVIYRKHTSALKRFREIHYAVTHKEIPYHPVKSCIAFFMAELLYRSLHDSDPHTDLFDFSCDAIRYFDQMPQGYESFHLYFMIHLMRYLGFCPATTTYRPGYVFNLTEGTFHPPDPSRPRCTATETALLIYKLQQSDIKNFERVIMTTQQRACLLDTLIEFFACHHPHPVSWRSLDVLREVNVNAS
jgi:DNA repair protein RecO (recombination protein O)